MARRSKSRLLLSWRKIFGMLPFFLHLASTGIRVSQNRAHKANPCEINQVTGILQDNPRHFWDHFLSAQEDLVNKDDGCHTGILNFLYNIHARTNVLAAQWLSLSFRDPIGAGSRLFSWYCSLTNHHLSRNIYYGSVAMEEFKKQPVICRFIQMI